MRPSGESAGWLTESEKFEICTQPPPDGAGGLRLSHHKAPTAASNTAAIDTIAARRRDERERTCSPDLEPVDSLPEAESSLSSSSASLISPTCWGRRSASLRRQRETIFS